MAPQRVTLAQLAAEAGVSVPTVSKVLNGRDDVAEATRARVERVVSEHGYRHRRRTAPPPGPRLIDLVFNELGNAWAVEVIRGVERTARPAGVEVVLSECLGTHQPRQEWLASVLARRPAGVLMVFSDLGDDQRTQLVARGIPYAIVDPVGEVDPEVPSVGSANYHGGLIATRHLLELGHRDIAVVTGPLDTFCSRARLSGHRDALLEAGVPYREDLVRTGDFSVEGGHEVALELLRGPARPTAVFACNDLTAFGVYRAARDLGVSVPGELSVVGYDDLPAARWVGPELTTVHQPLHEMAEAATRLLLSLVDGQDPAVRRMDLAVELRVRASTAPPAR
ncbi:LacI family DNA-binding transcriptional regulator [Kineococcus indalonis]|uniref:LacI family DNA-binding transcriptional regulator n=1 Tax=Kineococcus indalonis TaxID=2696566 RepID=UPI0014126FAB|nr:LacI family DNA-binding transcriptional regulator [Kineococcus indalonis]NAZ84876.1 substrate-binding domain-containing protein [Kineococcus indalonis]